MGEKRFKVNNNLNILILSCGTRNKIIQYFKRELAGQGLVIATDCSKLAPALYDADKYYILPRINTDNYLDMVIDICRKENIKAVLSLIDPELSIIAKNKTLFIDLGIVPVISDYDSVELCFDKFRMAKFLDENGFLTARSYIDKNKFYSDVDAGRISYPVFVKPVKGSASININKVYSKEELKVLLDRYDDLMIQEYMDGRELGADVYIDLISGELVSIFLKEKIKMRAGETDKSVSIKNNELFALISDFVKIANLSGIIDVDIFEKDGVYYISEVNPRFGGGYPHAHECGVNIVKMIIENIKGKANPINWGQYNEGAYMMKYSDIKINNKS